VCEKNEKKKKFLAGLSRDALLVLKGESHGVPLREGSYEIVALSLARSISRSLLFLLLTSIFFFFFFFFFFFSLLKVLTLNCRNDWQALKTGQQKCYFVANCDIVTHGNYGTFVNVCSQASDWPTTKRHPVPLSAVKSQKAS
jgi:hypothetical protein